MSGSKPKTAIYLNDDEAAIRSKIQRAFTGSVSSLAGHQQLGAVPEACSVFSLLYFHHSDDIYVEDVAKRYRKGSISTQELKQLTADFVVSEIAKHTVAKRHVQNNADYILHTPITSFLAT